MSKIGIVVILVVVLSSLGFVSWDAESGENSLIDISSMDASSGQDEDAQMVAEETDTEETSLVTLGVIPRISTIDFANADRMRDLHGRVTDGAGRPISGAAVEFFTEPWTRTRTLAVYVSGESARVPGPKSDTASDGRFLIRLDKAKAGGIRVSKDGCGDVVLFDCQAGQRVDVVLGPEAILNVQCVNQQGEPVGGVILNLSSPLKKKGRTDDDGCFTFRALSKGRADVSCLQMQYGHPGHKYAYLIEGKSTDLKIVMPMGRHLWGTVTDAETGNPIESAQVGVHSAMRSFVLTNELGLFKIPNYNGSVGYGEIHVLAAGYGRLSKTVGVVSQIDIQLEKADQVKGRLIDKNGEGLPLAVVQVVALMRVGRGRQMDTAVTTSDEAGNFLVSDLRRDLPHTLIVSAEEHGRLLLDFGARPEGPGTIDLGDIVLPEPRIIGGRVVDESGQPIVGVRVKLTGHNTERGRLRPERGFAYTPMGGNTETRRSDDLGRYKFGDLSAGTYAVQLTVPSFSKRIRTISLFPNADILDVDFCVVDNGVIRFLCTDGSGVPVQNVAFDGSFEFANRTVARAISDSSGKAVLRHLPDENYRISLHVSGGEYLPPTDFFARPNGKEIHIVLRHSASISGVLVTSDSSDPQGYLIWARWKEGQEKWTSSKGGGRFEITVPSDGLVDLSVEGQKYDGSSRRYDFPKENVLIGKVGGVQAPANNVILRIAPAAKTRDLTVKVLSPKGEIVVGAHLEDWTGLGISGVSDQEGLIHLTGLGYTKFHLSISPPKDLLSTFHRGQLVEVLPADQEVTVMLRRKVTIRGEVVDGGGNPVPNASVVAVGLEKEASLNSNNATETESGKDGRFTLSLGEAPMWRVYAVLDGKRSQAVVTKDEHERVVLTLN